MVFVTTSFMENPFEFGELFGVESPLSIDSQQSDRVGFYKGPIDFESLVRAIEESEKKLLLAFDYEKYISNDEIIVKTKDRETEEVFESTVEVNIPFTYTDGEGKERKLILSGSLNKKIANVRTDIYVARTSINPKKRRLSYNILFVYEGFDQRKNSTDKADINRVAIAITTRLYDDYEAAFDYLGYKRLQVEEEVAQGLTRHS